MINVKNNFNYKKIVVSVKFYMHHFVLNVRRRGTYNGLNGLTEKRPKL